MNRRTINEKSIIIKPQWTNNNFFNFVSQYILMEIHEHLKQHIIKVHFKVYRQFMKILIHTNKEKLIWYKAKIFYDIDVYDFYCSWFEQRLLTMIMVGK